MPDLSTRELWLLAPIAAVVLWMGVYPESFLKPMRVSIASLVERVEGAAPEGDAHLAAGEPAPAAAQSAAAHHCCHRSPNHSRFRCQKPFWRWARSYCCCSVRFVATVRWGFLPCCASAFINGRGLPFLGQ